MGSWRGMGQDGRAQPAKRYRGISGQIYRLNGHVGQGEAPGETGFPFPNTAQEAKKRFINSNK